MLEPMLQGTDKTPALITDYKEYHTDTTVKFVVRMTEEKLAQAEAAGLHKVFKLQSSLTCNSMVKPPTIWDIPAVFITDNKSGLFFFFNPRFFRFSSTTWVV